MPFMSDDEALRRAKRLFSVEEFEAFKLHMRMMQHFDDCIFANRPSPHCRLTDPAENLKWCRLALRIETLAFEDGFQELMMRSGQTG